MSPPSGPKPMVGRDSRAGLPRFDEQWIEQIEWFSLDRCAELSRWRVRDRSAQRQWLVVRASRQASLWELARLDREYALGPMLDEAWAAIPLARMGSAEGPLLVFNDNGGRPLSGVTTTTFSIERFLNVAITATRALASAHRHGIIHCDVRPDNFIIGDRDELRLTGFAFAQVLHDLGDSTLPMADTRLPYLAPELHGRHTPVFTRQSDLYALGVTFFQILSGHLPLSASDPVQWLHQHMAVTPPLASRWRADLPPELDNLLAGLLAKAPQNRPESADLLEAQLRTCLDQWHKVGKILTLCPSPTLPNRGRLATSSRGRQGLNEALSATSGQTGAHPALPADATSLIKLRVARLPERTRHILAALTILGNQVPMESLAAVSDVSVSELRPLLRPALRAGLLSEYCNSLSFTHDAVRESVSEQLPVGRQATLRIAYATVLLARLDADAQSDEVFRVATQIVQAQAQLLDPAQCQAFVELLMRASRLAMTHAGASTALDYLAQAERLLAGARPIDRRLSAAVALLSINARILNADYATADEQIESLLTCTTEPLHRADLYRLRCEICSLRGDYTAAVCTAIDGLAALGLIFSPAPTQQQVQHAWQALQQALGGRPAQVFLALPELRDGRCQSIVALLAAMVIPGSFIHPHLMLVTTCTIATLTLQHGMSAEAVHGLAWLGVASAHQFHAYLLGYEYADIAKKLLELPGHASSKVSVLLALDQVSVWTRPLPFALECAESAYRESILQGLPSFACYANNHIVSNLLVLGAPIERMLRQIDSGLVLARNLGFIDAQMILYAQARYIRRLAGNVAGSVAIPDSVEMTERVTRSSMGPLRFWWALYEGLLCFLDDDHQNAADHFDAAWALSWSAPAHIHLIDLAMFSVLNLAALQRISGKAQNVEQPMYHLRLWAQLNPRYFSDRLALAEAELLYLDGHSLQALQRYEEAIEHAQHCGAVHLLGLSHTLASRCYQQLGLQSGQRLHLRKAHAAWQRWGAVALAHRLETEHAFLHENTRGHVQDSDVSNSKKLDMLSITRACQALSREIEPDALIRTLLTNAVTHAGATYAALMLEHAGELRIEATGHTCSHGIDICLSNAPATVQTVPLNLILQVKHKHESLLINVCDALRGGNVDPYLTRLESGSIMCLPLIQQNEVIGVLYLENALAPDAFEASRIGVLELLAAQAAISLSTSRHYTELLAENQRRRDSESTLQRTQTLLAIGQEVSRYGTFVWKPSTEPSFWSPRLLAELGLSLPATDDYQRDPAMLVHIDDRQRFVHSLADAGERLEAFRVEFRTVSLDGAFHYLELAGEADGTDTLIGVVSDVTERRQTETDLHAARTELDRTSQATILGELAASIAHEVNQPLASILSNAGASIRWLQREQPQIGEAIEGIQDILIEGQRTADIIRAMRALAHQAPLERKPLAMDRVIRQVLAITQPDLNDKHVTTLEKLASGTKVYGDSIQLQQVMRNLIINAVEAMQALAPGSRRLTLETRLIGHEVLTIVEDSGPGVPADKSASIFQTFYSTKPSGMGMGLAICATIVATHGGFLGCSRGRGGESLFFFTLPVHPSG